MQQLQAFVDKVNKKLAAKLQLLKNKTKNDSEINWLKAVVKIEA